MPWPWFDELEEAGDRARFACFLTRPVSLGQGAERLGITRVRSTVRESSEGMARCRGMLCFQAHDFAKPKRSCAADPLIASGLRELDSCELNGRSWRGELGRGRSLMASQSKPGLS